MTDDNSALELEKKELLSYYSTDELLLFKTILEENVYQASNQLTTVEIVSGVGTDGK